MLRYCLVSCWFRIGCSNNDVLLAYYDTLIQSTTRNISRRQVTNSSGFLVASAPKQTTSKTCIDFSFSKLRARQELLSAVIRVNYCTLTCFEKMHESKWVNTGKRLCSRQIRSGGWHYREWLVISKTIFSVLWLVVVHCMHFHSLKTEKALLLITFSETSTIVHLQTDSCWVQEG